MGVAADGREVQYCELGEHLKLHRQKRAVAVAFKRSPRKETQLPREMQAFLDHGLEKEGWSPSTYTTYKQGLLIFCEWLKSRFQGAGWNWCEIDREMLQEYRAYIKEKRHYRSSTINHRESIAKNFLKYLCPTDSPAAKAARGRRGLRVPRLSTTRFIGEIEFEAALQRARSGPYPERDVAILELIYRTGLWLHELKALNREDVYLKWPAIRVHGTEGRSDRAVIIPQRAAQALAAYLESLPVADGSSPLFISRRRDRLSRKHIWHVIVQYVRVDPRTLRYSFVRQALEEGWDLRDLQETLDHEAIKSTALYRDSAQQHDVEQIEPPRDRLVVEPKSTSMVRPPRWEVIDSFILEHSDRLEAENLARLNDDGEPEPSDALLSVLMTEPYELVPMGEDGEEEYNFDLERVIKKAKKRRSEENG